MNAHLGDIDWICDKSVKHSRKRSAWVNRKLLSDSMHVITWEALIVWISELKESITFILRRFVKTVSNEGECSRATREFVGLFSRREKPTFDSKTTLSTQVIEKRRVLLEWFELCDISLPHFIETLPLLTIVATNRTPLYQSSSQGHIFPDSKRHSDTYLISLPLERWFGRRGR